MPTIFSPEWYARHQARFGRAARVVDTDQPSSRGPAVAPATVRASAKADAVGAGTNQPAATTDVASSAPTTADAGATRVGATGTYESGRASGSNPGPAAATNITPPRTAGQALAEARHERWKAKQAGAEADKLYPLVSLCRAEGLPEPVPEYRFHPTRRWRFDYCWPLHKVALEVEGGVWTQGRHTRGQGFVDDMAKYNAAALLGFIVLRYTPQQLTASLADLRLALARTA